MLSKKPFKAILIALSLGLIAGLVLVYYHHSALSLSKKSIYQGIKKEGCIYTTDLKHGYSAIFITDCAMDTTSDSIMKLPGQNNSEIDTAAGKTLISDTSLVQATSTIRCSSNCGGVVHIAWIKPTDFDGLNKIVIYHDLSVTRSQFEAAIKNLKITN